MKILCLTCSRKYSFACACTLNYLFRNRKASVWPKHKAEKVRWRRAVQFLQGRTQGIIKGRFFNAKKKAIGITLSISVYIWISAYFEEKKLNEGNRIIFIGLNSRYMINKCYRTIVSLPKYIIFFFAHVGRRTFLSWILRENHMWHSISFTKCTTLRRSSEFHFLF